VVDVTAGGHATAAGPENVDAAPAAGEGVLLVVVRCALHCAQRRVAGVVRVVVGARPAAGVRPAGGGAARGVNRKVPQRFLLPFMNTSMTACGYACAVASSFERTMHTCMQGADGLRRGYIIRRRYVRDRMFALAHDWREVGATEGEGMWTEQQTTNFQEGKQRRRRRRGRASTHRQ
jgi:hypothetical protein